MTQEIQQEPDDQFAARMKEETMRADAMRSNQQSAFVAIVDSSDAQTPFTEVRNYRRGPNTADSRLSRDNVVAALKEGSAEVNDRGGRRVGYMNNRLDLLLDLECRRLLDRLPYTPSREETLASLLKRECRNMTPEEQYQLGLLDKRSNKEVLRPLILGKERDRREATTAVEQEVGTTEQDERNVSAQTAADTPMAPEAFPQGPVPKTASSPFLASPVSPSVPPLSMPLPSCVSPGTEWLKPASSQPLKLPGIQIQRTVAPPQEKTISLSCPIGRYTVPVLDVIQNPGYVVIIQREDASLLISFEANNTAYRIDGINANLEFSGIAFNFNGAVYTIMVTK